MSKSEQTSSRVAFLVIVVLVGGCALTGLMVWERIGPYTASTDARLLGTWRHDVDRVPLEFKPDGSVESRTVTTLQFRTNDGGVSEPVRVEEPVTGQYRLAAPGTVEVLYPDRSVWVPVRYMIENNRLTLMQPDGTVKHYSRAE